MTLQEIVLVIARITYKPGWTLLLGVDGDRPFLQCEVSVEADASLDSHKRDGSRAPWKSGKRYLSYYMCRQEIVGAALAVFKDAEMHEVHEWFRYRGAAIFNPHLDPDVLAEVARKKTSFVTRQNAMSMAEN
ncbi:MAG: hypothetical protein EOQ89_03455 [Mesorhizobium sp.]|nr:MAG: hypothetical protein EOQ89_03455 [Mesorhizobium sp.]